METPSLWDKLTPKPDFVPEADSANLTDEEADQWLRDMNEEQDKYWREHLKDDVLDMLYLSALSRGGNFNGDIDFRIFAP